MQINHPALYDIKRCPILPVNSPSLKLSALSSILIHSDRVLFITLAVQFFVHQQLISSREGPLLYEMHGGKHMAFEKWDYETNGYRNFMGDAHAWKCSLCGDVYHGDTPPVECPYCLAPGYTYQEIWPIKQVPVNTEPIPNRMKALSKEERKDEGQWSRSIKSLKLSAHLKPA